MGLFSRLVRPAAGIPTSELGPAAGPFPAGLTLPQYLDEGADESRERPDRVARSAAARARAGEPLFRRGNLLGDLVGSVLDAVVGIAVGKTLGPSGGQILGVIQRSTAVPGQPPSSSAPVDQELEVDERTPLAEAVRQRDPYAIETARRRAESAARGVRIDAEIERLGTSSVGADMDLDGREVIAIDRVYIGPDDEAV